ncbi:MAG: hypothetical protein AAFN13_14110 [Bacteroidota bacterium]
MRYALVLVLLLGIVPGASGQIAFLAPDRPTLQFGGAVSAAESTSGFATEMTLLGNGRIGLQLGAGFFTSDIVDERNRESELSVRSFSIGPVLYPSRQTDEQQLTVAIGLAYSRTIYPDLDVSGFNAFTLGLDVARNIIPDAVAGGVAPHLAAGVSFQQQPGGGTGNVQVVSVSGGVELGARLSPSSFLVFDPSVSVVLVEGTRTFGVGLRVALGFAVAE